MYENDTCNSSVIQDVFVTQIPGPKSLKCCHAWEQTPVWLSMTV